MKQTTAVIAARMGSKRLPGKVLLPIMGRPMLAYQIERVRKACGVRRVVLATSDQPADDAVARFCKSENVNCYRGSETDVLDRLFRAAEYHQADPVIRLTGDDPLADPALIDRLIVLFQEGACDYASNVNPPTFPDGLDIEILAFETLRRIWMQAGDIYNREHVTWFLRKNPSLFRIRNLEHDPDLSGLHWAVDTPADFEFVRSVFETLYSQNPDFGLADILAFSRQGV